MATLVTDGFDPGDDDIVIRILQKWRGGPISDALFTVLAGILPQPIVEIVILRFIEEKLQTLLIPRPAGDIIWPGMFHTPGVALRGADFRREDKTPLNGAFERIQREIGSPFLGQPEFVGYHFGNGARGPESSFIFVAQVATDAILREDAFWHDVDTLGDNEQFIQHQLAFIRMVSDHFGPGGQFIVKTRQFTLEREQSNRQLEADLRRYHNADAAKPFAYGPNDDPI